MERSEATGLKRPEKSWGWNSFPGISEIDLSCVSLVNAIDHLRRKHQLAPGAVFELHVAPREYQTAVAILSAIEADGEIVGISQSNVFKEKALIAERESGDAWYVSVASRERSQKE